MKPRTRAAIALCPTGTVQGSWFFMHVDTSRVVKRSQWTVLPITNLLVRTLNHQAGTTGIGQRDQLAWRLGGGPLQEENPSENEDPSPQDTDTSVDLDPGGAFTDLENDYVWETTPEVNSSEPEGNVVTADNDIPVDNYKGPLERSPFRPIDQPDLNRG